MSKTLSGSVKSDAEKTLNNLKYLTFGIVYAVFAFWMLINGENNLSYWNSSWTYSILFYISGVALFLSVTKNLPDDLKHSTTSENILTFLICLPIFVIVFNIFSDFGFWFTGIEKIPGEQVIPTALFHIGIVSTSEELIFRGVLFEKLKKVNIFLAYILSSVLFGIFHTASYGGDFGLIFVAIVMGLLLCVLYEKINLGASIAFHGAYNAVVSGAIVLMVMFF